MASGLGINTMGKRFYEWPFARISNDRLKEGSSFLSILSARLKIPVAAFGLKKYFCDTSWVSIQSNNEDSATLLGDSEIFTVKHTPSDTIPEFVQRLEYDCEVSSSVTREKAVHVFEDKGSWHACSNEAHKVMKESRLAPSKPSTRAHSRQTKILAGESSDPNIGSWYIFNFDTPYVI
jgi:hypothetical protein